MMKTNKSFLLLDAKRLRYEAFSLIEMIGVLAVIAVLAAALLPALLKETDKLVADQEVATLQSFATGIQNNVLRTRTIPDSSSWVSVVTNELGMNTSLVSSNSRSRLRVFVIDTNGFSPIALPYSQTSAGTNAPPARARFMLVSSLGATLPGGLTSNPSQAIFNDLWSTTDGTMPANAIWSGWNRGRAEDLLVQRINLTPYFVHLILTANNSTMNYATYRVDTGLTNGVIGAGRDAWFIQGSVLTLYSNSVPDSQQILQRDVSFVYDQNVWRSSITSVSYMNTNAPDLSSLVNAFANAGPSIATNLPTRVVNDFITYMTAYDQWADANFIPGGLKGSAIAAYNNMMNDVNSLVTIVNPGN